MSGEVAGPRCLLAAGGHLRQAGLDALHAAAVPDRGQSPGLRVRAGGRGRHIRPRVQHSQPCPRLPGNAVTPLTMTWQFSPIGMAWCKNVSFHFSVSNMY